MQTSSTSFNYSNLFSLLLLLLSSIFLIVFFIYHFAVITDSYQVELREGAAVSFTNAIVRGFNPYAYQNQPELTNVYGIFYSFLVYPFAKFLGSTLLIHRIISALFIFLILIIIFIHLKHQKTELPLILGGSCLIYGSLLYMAPPCAKPDSLALFLFLCSLLIPFLLKQSKLSLTISGICLILVFFTKMYYILGIPALSLYLFLFHSKIKGIVYFLITSLFLLLSCYYMSQIYPTYLDNSFFNHINISSNNLNWALKQYYYFLAYNFSFAIVLILLASMGCYESFKGLSWNITNSNLFKISINISELSEPLLVSPKVKYIDYLFGLFFLVLLLKLGKHTGSFLVYYFSLLTPILVVFVLSKIRNRFNLKLIFQLLLIVNIPFFYFAVLPNLHLKNIRDENIRINNWHKIENIVETSSPVYNHPAITSIMVNNNQKIYNNGQSQYFIWGAERKSIYRFFFETNYFIKQRNSEFLKYLTMKIREQYFNIIIKDVYDPFIPESEIKGYYFLREIVKISMPFTEQEWDLEIWERK